MADSKSNPWAPSSGSGAASAPETAGAGGSGGSNPWGGGEAAGQGPSSTDWLSGSVPVEEADKGFDLINPFADTLIPLDVWVEQALNWLVDNFRPVFQAIQKPIDTVLAGIENTLLMTPEVLMIAIVGLLAWQAAGRKVAIGAIVSVTVVGLIGAWDEAMVTLALVLTSVFFCIVIGLPVGIWLSRSDKALTVVRPILDAMQTTPAFVYLVPIVMLFGIGNVPGVVVTIIFALPPLIRLTNLGIRQVPGDLVEASRSFGASPRQLLFKVQLPLAMPTIMAGVNQTLMLALSMVVIASMIAVGGLGQMVLRGIGRLDMGLAAVGGLGIVLLAIILDRVTQAMGMGGRERGNVRWYETGPVGLVRSVFGRNSTPSDAAPVPLEEASVRTEA